MALELFLMGSISQCTLECSHVARLIKLREVSYKAEDKSLELEAPGTGIS